LWLLAWLEAATLTGDEVFKACSELLSLVPGKPGIFLRRGFYRMCLEACALDCHIGFGTILAHPQVRIGRNVYIGHGCSLGKVIIEDDVAIGSNVDILSGRHQHGFSDPRRPIRDQVGVFQAIRIGRNVWIGNSAILMADIEDDCVIGAGSVVVRPIPARSVAAGNPATVKRSRDETPDWDQNPGPAAPRLTRVLTNGQRIS
jgi:acetyltransferase-like isoleucine patch superfamily enzyme